MTEKKSTDKKPVAPRRKSQDSATGGKKRGADSALTAATDVGQAATTGSDAPNAVDDGSQELVVVGLGGSAGSLSAIQKFLQQMPSDSGMAFVFVPHLDPNRESLMVELLARQTEMPVREIAHDVPVEANTVYVLPPGFDVLIVSGRLHLIRRDASSRFFTVLDTFFRSLAADLQERAIGIILSGTGNYGTLGLKEIKLAGGMVIVQTPESAEYDQMPRSAMETGFVDFVLLPEQMPAALLKYVKHPYVNRTAEPVFSPTRDADHLGLILAVLKAKTNCDFRAYRQSMVLRRLHRRMGLLSIHTISDYLNCLRESPDELAALHNDLLIGVTSFFREGDAFQELREHIIPELVERADINNPVRVWVPACATGEEVYTLAILLSEQFNEASKPASFLVFATDINERSLNTGRRGIYPETIETDLSPERLQRFFVKIDQHHYQVSKQLREHVLFATQNLLADSPFSKLHLVSCRNLLIYVDLEIQRKVIRMFHYALKDDGYLLLGPSESIAGQADLFEAISKKWRLFRRRHFVGTQPMEFPIVTTPEHRSKFAPQAPRVPEIAYQELMQREILQDYTPAAVLVSRKCEILSSFGPLVDYLEFPAGDFTRDLLSMARQGVRAKLRAAVRKAVQSGQVVTKVSARVKRNGSYFPCTISVKPITESKDLASLLLITFEDQSTSTDPQLQPGTDARELAVHGEQVAEDSKLIRQLEHELAFARGELQSSAEEYASSSAELKTANEEVQSMNEELQSANEELESSKEELQSMNEELVTVNHQLQDRHLELEKALSDLTNLTASSDIATLFLDVDFRIKYFTPATVKLLQLLPTDVGRPISAFAYRFTDDTLLSDCRAVLDELAPLEKEVWTEVESSQRHQPDDQHPPLMDSIANRRYYLRRTLPYFGTNDRLEGVVITFLEITQRIISEAESRRLATVLMDSNDAVTMQDFKGRILAWNFAAEQMYGYTEQQALAMNIRDLVPQDKLDEMLGLFQALGQGQVIEPFETQRVASDGRFLDVALTVTAVRDEVGKSVGMATTERDIGVIKRAERERDQLLRDLKERNSELQQFTYAVSHDLKTPLVTIGGFVELLERDIKQGRHEEVGRSLQQIQTAIDLMEEMLKDLLEMARAGVPPTDIQEVDLRELVREVGDLCLATGSKVELSIADDLPVVAVNRRQYRQLFQNLLDNARQFMGDQSAPRIEVGVRNDFDRRTCYVRDNGIGVETSDLQAVFRAFTQFNKQFASGTGLGLAIAKRIVEQSGGRIWVESEGRNRGSTFCFTLPMESK